MLEQEELEEKIEARSRKIKELMIRNDSINREIKEFFEELNVTSEQLTSFIGKKDNFTEKNWEEIQKEREKIDSKLDRELSNVRNPLKVKEALSSLKIGQHWMFVK